MKENFIKKITTTSLSTIALGMSKRAANSRCTVVYHQPRLPDAIRKLRKF